MILIFLIYLIKSRAKKNNNYNAMVNSFGDVSGKSFQMKQNKRILLAEENTEETGDKQDKPTATENEKPLEATKEVTASESKDVQPTQSTSEKHSEENTNVKKTTSQTYPNNNSENKHSKFKSIMIISFCCIIALSLIIIVSVYINSLRKKKLEKTSSDIEIFEEDMIYI